MCVCVCVCVRLYRFVHERIKVQDRQTDRQIDMKYRVNSYQSVSLSIYLSNNIYI